MADFPQDLLLQYKITTNKLRKFQRVVFKRFAPNVSEVSDEFQRLAVKFDNAVLPEYAGLCYLGAAKCEKALNNPLSEVHLLLKSARAFKTADIDNLCVRSNAHEHIQGALSCYNQALYQFDDNSVMKAAIIREVKKIHPNCELTSNFVSPAHRAHELELAANQCIQVDDFEGALEKLTEIYDDISERKVQTFYGKLLRKHEITRILLIILLDLPPARQSPSNVKLVESFSNFDESIDSSDTISSLRHSLLVMNSLQQLILAYKSKAFKTIIECEIPLVASIPGLSECQQVLLKRIQEKYRKLL